MVFEVSFLAFSAIAPTLVAPFNQIFFDHSPSPYLKRPNFLCSAESLAMASFLRPYIELSLESPNNERSVGTVSMTSILTLLRLKSRFTFYHLIPDP